LVEVHLHRVIQEALTNVRRHAAASRVEVRIRQSPAGWDVVVSDDGTGFDAAGSGTGRLGSYGLLTMRERVAGLGGQFAIESQPGKGTRVCIFVPCNPDH
jgi:signal transduction histidine kinase